MKRFAVIFVCLLALIGVMRLYHSLKPRTVCAQYEYKMEIKEEPLSKEELQVRYELAKKQYYSTENYRSYVINYFALPYESQPYIEQLIQEDIAKEITFAYALSVFYQNRNSLAAMEQNKAIYKKMCTLGDSYGCVLADPLNLKEGQPQDYALLHENKDNMTKYCVAVREAWKTFGIEYFHSFRNQYLLYKRCQLYEGYNFSRSVIQDRSFFLAFGDEGKFIYARHMLGKGKEKEALRLFEELIQFDGRIQSNAYACMATYYTSYKPDKQKAEYYAEEALKHGNIFRGKLPYTPYINNYFGACLW